VVLPWKYNTAGGQIDFQVEAIIGNVTNVWVFGPANDPRSNQAFSWSCERIWTIEQTSGWSNTQTLTLPENYIAPTFPPTSTITPYQEPEQTELLQIILAVALILTVIGTGLLVYFKKRNHARINKHSEIEQFST
jgi:hypothetical protein